MSKAEIIEELAKLTPDERQEVRLRLAEMDQDDWLDSGELTSAEKALIEERFREIDTNPKASLSWADAKERLMAPYKR